MKAREISESVRKRKISALEILDGAFREIEKKDKKTGAFLEVFRESALKKAGEIDETVQRGDCPGRLAGVPIALKDNILYAGHRASCASRMLENYVAPYTATAVSNLLKEGAIIIGRTNMDEFAMGSSTENSAFKKTLNPLNTDKVPGGSSGGSAAAVAAGMVPAALGSDTGGSVRQPAAFCGICGLRPSYGSVSRNGLVAFSSSLDQIGPMASDMEDLELVFDVIAGKDPKDATSRDTGGFDCGGRIRIGIPTDDILEPASAEILECFEKMLSELKSAGFKTTQVRLPNMKYAIQAYCVISCAEASSNLARYGGGACGPGGEKLSRTRNAFFSKEVKKRILFGTWCLSSGYPEKYYLKARAAALLVKKDFDTAFEKADIIVMPTVPETAFSFGEKKGGALSMYFSDIFTVPHSLAGICSLNYPVKTGTLPAGIQFAAKAFCERKIFETLKRIEK